MHEQNIRYMAIHNIKHTCVLCIFMCNEENNFDIAIYRHFMDFYYYGMMFRIHIYVTCIGKENIINGREEKCLVIITPMVLDFITKHILFCEQ